MPDDANRSRSTPSRPQGTHHDRPLGWGKTREMNAIEAMMWRGEADPRMRSTITSFGVLDCAPEWDRFVAHAKAQGDPSIAGNRCHRESCHYHCLRQWHRPRRCRRGRHYQGPRG